jgi:hypothetical protein
VVDRVVEDVVEGVVVLLFGLDHSGPEALAEDVMLAAVAFVEGTGVLAVEVAHPIGEVGQWRLDDQVVVVAEEAACVEAPAIVPSDALQDLEEDDAVPVVEVDRRVVVPLRPDVVVGPGGEISQRASHDSTVTTTRGPDRRVGRLGAETQRTRHVPGT